METRHKLEAERQNSKPARIRIHFSLVITRSVSIDFAVSRLSVCAFCEGQIPPRKFAGRP